MGYGRGQDLLTSGAVLVLKVDILAGHHNPVNLSL